MQEVFTSLHPTEQEASELKIIETTEPDETRLIRLRDIIPEGMRVGYRKLPEDERNNIFYDKKDYEIYEPAEIDKDLLGEVLDKHGLNLNSSVLVLPFGAHNRVGWETRRLYFALALDNVGKFNKQPRVKEIEPNYKNLPVTRIVSFGECNVACPYCKRDCQFIDESGVPIISMPVPIKEIARLGEGAQKRGEIIRFSGGDPVMFPKQTLALAEYFARRHGAKVSIAHNGTGTSWVEKMVPYLSSAAIDLKGVPEKIGKIMGISEAKGPRLYQRSLDTQKLISQNGILLDVRTPIFGETTIEEMQRLAEDIRKTNNPDYTFWTWRMYKPVQGCDWVVPSRENVIEMMAVVSRQIPDLWMGMRAKWEKGGMLYFRNGQLTGKSADVTNEDVAEMGSGNLVSLG